MKRVRFYSTRLCDKCHRPFKAARKDAKFCSPACRKRASRGGEVKRRKPVTNVTLNQLELLLIKHGGK